MNIRNILRFGSKDIQSVDVRPYISQNEIAEGNSSIVVDSDYIDLLNISYLSLWIFSKGGDYAVGDLITISLYKEMVVENELTKFHITDLTATLPSAINSNASRIIVDDTNKFITEATHCKLSGNINSSNSVKLLLEKLSALIKQ